MELGYEEFNCTGGEIVHVNLINFRISCGEVSLSLQHIIQFWGWGDISTFSFRH